MNKKIMFVCNRLGSGGAERVISVLANKFIEKNYQVYILAFSKSEQEYALNQKIKVCYQQLSGSAFKRIKRIRAIRHYVKLFKIDTVIAFSHYINISAIIAGMFLKVKVIISERNDPAHLENKKVLTLVRKILYPRAAALVCQTYDARDYFSFIKAAPVVVIPNPIMENLPQPYAGIRSQRLVTFSRLEPQKNIGMVIAAFCKLHKDFDHYVLEIYGEGSCLSELKAYTAALDLEKNILFHPFCLDIHHKILDASIFVLGSDYEGLSNAMLEAMALGLPCVVTDCPGGGARMMIASYENGILVPVGDVQAMYVAMKYMIENPKHAAHMSKNAAKIRSDLAADKIISMWEQLL